jgi:hypothetical protein
MTRFEDLPRNMQALILAKLAVEMDFHKSSNIHHLASKRATDVTGVWRDICRKAGQSTCTIPVAAMGPRGRDAGSQ